MCMLNIFILKNSSKYRFPKGKISFFGLWNSKRCWSFLFNWEFCCIRAALQSIKCNFVLIVFVANSILCIWQNPPSHRRLRLWSLSFSFFVFFPLSFLPFLSPYYQNIGLSHLKELLKYWLVWHSFI